MDYGTKDFNDRIEINGSRLKVTIAKPGTYYRGSRFDWTGFITQIELDGIHRFCVPESLHFGEGTGGAGLCNEFGINSAIGYDEIKPGEKFPKIGVGLLTKVEDSPYFFAYPFEIEPFPFSVSMNENGVEFITEPMDCNGYSARLKKLISVNGNRMRIDYRLENTGTKQIDTHEYCHNFIGIDGHLVGQDYLLKVSFDVELDDIPEAELLKAEGNTITWKGRPEDPFYNKPRGFDKGKPHVWELVHKPSGVGVKEYSNLPTSLIALWGITHVISPEVFIDISIAPGEVCEWSREYEFFCNK